MLAGQKTGNREGHLHGCGVTRGGLGALITAAALVVMVGMLVVGCGQGEGSGSRSTAWLPPAFTGEAYERTLRAVAEKDGDAFPVSVVMNSYAMPGDNAPSWTYLFASQRYAKFYAVFNYSTKAAASIYGATTWNLEDWENAPKDIPSDVQTDADVAYRSVIESHPSYSDKPFRISFLAYEPEIEKTDDAPKTMTWYFYFTTEEALERFDSSAENPNDIADAVIVVDAMSGEVSQLR